MSTKDPEKRHANWRRYLVRVKYRVWSHYSNGTPACACCRETRLEFLCLDHLDGGGNRHREAAGFTSRRALYQDLRESNFPAGYRVLCHNCNSALAWCRYCPHADADRTAETLAMLLRPSPARTRHSPT